MELLDDKKFLKITGFLFAFVSATHLLRAGLGWDMVIGSFDFPIAWSYYAAFLAFFLSSVSFALAGSSVKPLVSSRGKKSKKKKK
tara:strand:- start:422 stop:676 length:255 start_codon:yes stop_codon:yes gene_type:complete